MREQGKVQALLVELTASKVAYSRAYIKAREGKLNAHAPTDADARAGALIALAVQRVRDPEIVRLELWSIIGIPRGDIE